MSSYRLLHIDDEPAIGDLIGRIGRGCGYEVHTASDPDYFKELYKTFQPHVVVLDLGMPEADGVEILEFLAGQGSRSDIVFFSGFQKELLDVAYRLGEAHGLKMAGIIKKPPRAGELKFLLMRLPSEGS